MVRLGWVRNSINRHTDRLVKMFAWATAQKLIEGKELPLARKKMIDIHSEKIRTLPNLARRVPPKGVNASTGWRWVTKGVRGVKLEAVLIGGIWHSSDEALQRFIDRVTAAANGETVPARTSAERERAIAAAERELADAGI